MKAINLRALSMLALGLVLTTIYNNCSDVKFEDAPVSTIKSVPPDIIDDAIKNCADAAAKGKLKHLSQDIFFMDTRNEVNGLNSTNKVVCKFKSGPTTDDVPDASGNLTMKNEYLRARHEQKSAALNLPANAVVCNAEILAKKQQFYYDDIFYFTFNDIVVASSLKRSLAFLDTVSYDVNGSPMSFHKYDWSKITAGNSDFIGVNSSPDDYCIGSSGNYGACSWPLSQQSGYVQMSWTPEVLVPVSLLSASPAQKFGFVVTGDNDPNDDCYHEDFDLNVKVDYFEM